MKTKALFAASLVANALLLSAVGYMWKQSTEDLSSLPPLLVCVPQPEPAAAAPPGAVTASAVKAPKTVDCGWIGSDDYRRYVAQLRSLGCPEERIRGVITADINDLFHWRARGHLYSANQVHP